MVLPFQVKYLPEREKWVAIGEDSVITLSDKKSTAKNKAMGEAQTIADERRIVVTINIHDKNNRYQRTETVTPA